MNIYFMGEREQNTRMMVELSEKKLVLVEGSRSHYGGWAELFVP